MSLPAKVDQHLGLGAGIAMEDRWTSRQIFAPRDECVLEHRFCPEPVFLTRSNGAAWFVEDKPDGGSLRMLHTQIDPGCEIRPGGSGKLSRR